MNISHFKSILCDNLNISYIQAKINTLSKQKRSRYKIHSVYCFIYGEQCSPLRDYNIIAGLSQSRL